MKSSSEGCSEINPIAASLDPLDFGPVGHFVLDVGFRVVFWNRCMESWTGIERDQIVSTSVFGQYPHIEEPRYRDRIASVFKGGPPVVFSSQFHPHLFTSKLPGGQLRVLHTTATRIRCQVDGGYLALFSVEDVTSLLDAIETIRTALQRVEAEVAVRKRAESALERKVEELNAALKEIDTLRDIIPICASCKKIRDDAGYWIQLESYFQKHSLTAFSHGICPECMEKLYPDLEADPVKEPEHST